MLSHPKKIIKTVILFYFLGFAIELDGDKWGKSRRWLMMVKLYDIKFLFDIDAMIESIYVGWKWHRCFYGFDGLSKNVVCPHWQF